MNVEGTNKNPANPAVDETVVDYPSDPRPPQKGWRRFLIPALITLAVLGGVGWIVFSRFIMPLIMLSQMPPPPPTQVPVANPKRATIDDSADYSATLDSRQSVNLQPRVSGQVSAIFVRAGDRVAAGQPVLQIDPREQRAQVASREAAAGTAQAEITTAQADVAAARDTLQSLQAQRQARLSDLQLNQREYERYQSLVSQGAESRQVLDQRLNALRTAQASLRQTEAEIRAQQSAIARAQANVGRNRSALEQQQASVREGEVQLQYYTINAPFSGTIGDIPIKVGDFVETSTQLMRITQNEELEIQIGVPLERSPDLRRGLPVQLLDNQGKAVQSGSISFVSPDVDATSQSVLVKAVFPNVRGQLRTNQFTRARVIWARRPGVLVPTTAISRLGGKDFVFVEAPYRNSGCKAPAAGGGGGKPPEIPPDQTVAVQKPVTLGKIIGNDQEIAEGVKANDRVVVSGILQLQNCMPIAAQGQ
ncbi:efflux RND transporter periplasmic adaptor subunit [Leptolyngbya sp. FACHB-36]|uniref:efflux RND transporter periplasmic adaptor subunit n=1 Tax=Leptolyngbya sp. FACHB-36 TaxID=2692808 RepID=UPI001680720B|nr:efflux RND transporter periplasmic adaptor subunit [Leptolyngbya sp. FACHB-36]MBD2021356.1 efflux RND transporter periplasmic adaptor subunit [Leptolyngbya sp. FACHB-36]